MAKNHARNGLNQVDATDLPQIIGKPPVMGQSQACLCAYFSIESTASDSNLLFGPVMLCSLSHTGRALVAKWIRHNSGDTQLIQTSGETINDMLGLFSILIGSAHTTMVSIDQSPESTRHGRHEHLHLVLIPYTILGILILLTLPLLAGRCSSSTNPNGRTRVTAGAKPGHSSAKWINDDGANRAKS